MPETRIFCIAISLLFSVSNISGIRYELRRGKRRIVTPEIRAYFYLLIGLQWFMAALIFAVGWERFVENADNAGLIIGWLICILTLPPIGLIWFEFFLYKFRKRRTPNESND